MYSRVMAGASESGLIMPSFRKPPVVEVALSISFSPLPDLQFGAMADLRSFWANDFPQAIEQPFLEPAPSPMQGIRINFGPPPRRIWLLNEAGDRVLQIQHDRLIANWRAVQGVTSEYPRYDVLREQFLRRWNDFQGFVADRGIAPRVETNGAEVTYINVINADADSPNIAIADVLKMNREGELWRGDVRTTAVTQTWNLVEAQTTLTMIANIDTSTTGHPVVLQIIANTRAGEDRSPTEALDLAHEFVVGTFGVITTDELQHRWERE